MNSNFASTIPALDSIQRECNGMFVKKLIKCGNLLQGEFAITHYLIPQFSLSPECLIRNAVKFQVRASVNRGTQNSHSIFTGNQPAQVFNELYIFVRFIKNDEIRDGNNYRMQLSSNKLNITEKIFLTDDGTWHLIHEASNMRELCFDVKVLLDIVPSVNCFCSLHDDTELTDFVLRGQDGCVPIHKIALASSSSVLRRMLSGSWKETSVGAVEVPGTSRLTLQHFKDYIYLGILPDNGLDQLLLLAEYYMMPDLEQRCVDKIVNGLTAENVCEFMEFAVRNEARRLMLGIFEYIQCGAVKVNEMRKYVLRDIKNSQE